MPTWQHRALSQLPPSKCRLPSRRLGQALGVWVQPPRRESHICALQKFQIPQRTDCKFNIEKGMAAHQMQAAELEAAEGEDDDLNDGEPRNVLKRLMR